MQHVMLDLETLSVRPDAALLSIGAVRFDETGVANIEEHGHIWQFYRVFETPTGHLDVETIRWWMEQSNEARQVFCDKAHFFPEPLILCEFKEFFEHVPDSLLWAWPTTADEVWLRNCYLRQGFREQPNRGSEWQLPWTHRQVRCARTVAQLLCLGRAPNSAEHNALADARAQAEQMVVALRKFRYLAHHNPDGEFDEMAEVA